MVRRSLLLAQLALVGVLSVLAFPGSGSALSAVFIVLTPTGPSPATLTIPVFMYPVWVNQDSVPHTVTFANGQCSIQIAPGAYGQCTGPFASGAGDYPYTVDGTAQASITLAVAGRTVTLRGKRHTIHQGSILTLHGRLVVQTGGPPGLEGPWQPVTVVARAVGHRWFHRVAVVTAHPHHSRNPGNAYSVWHLRVHPRVRTTYRAVANSQPKGGQYWQRALSGPFRVRVTR